jgi:hypothetical protein
MVYDMYTITLRVWLCLLSWISTCQCNDACGRAACTWISHDQVTGDAAHKRFASLAPDPPSCDDYPLLGRSYSTHHGAIMASGLDVLGGIASSLQLVQTIPAIKDYIISVRSAPAEVLGVQTTLAMLEAALEGIKALDTDTRNRIIPAVSLTAVPSHWTSQTLRPYTVLDAIDGELQLLRSALEGSSSPAIWPIRREQVLELQSRLKDYIDIIHLSLITATCDKQACVIIFLGALGGH